jgi:hypothetical protein
MLDTLTDAAQSCAYRLAWCARANQLTIEARRGAARRVSADFTVVANVGRYQANVVCNDADVAISVLCGCLSPRRHKDIDPRRHSWMG